MAGDTGMAGRVALLLWAQTLGLAGARTPQLLVEPPWVPAVRWDRVTLTCQGLGTAGATTWYKDGQRWGQRGRDRITVTKSGTYTCDKPGTELSSPVTVSDAGLVLQVPARALLEGDTVTLRCRGWKDNTVTSVSFYHEEEKLRWHHDGTELSLSPLRLQHSGRYSCEGWVEHWASKKLQESQAVTVTVQELFSVPVLEGPPEPTEGSPLNLRCLSTRSPLRPRAPLLHVFYRDGQMVGGSWGSPQLLVPTVGVSHSGNYSCEVRSEGGVVRKSSARLRVTVRRVPPSGVSLSAQPPGAQVALGDRLVLSCAVAEGTGPLSFSWHREGSGAPLGTGPRLELRHVGDNDSGQYRCRVSDGDSVAESDPLNVTVLGGGPGSPPGAWGRRGGTFGHLPVRGHQPAGTGRAPRVPGAQHGGGTGGDTAGTRGHSGRGGRWDPFVPGPARGCHCGLAAVAPRGRQGTPGKGPPKSHSPPRGGGGAVHPNCDHREDRGVPSCHHTPGPPGDLCRAAGTPRATSGTR
uniref:Fc receptor-like protein 4 n=1 Tax=Taeniopygia guttata TaxID=59729 RepID=A0A674G8T2_TAEGU